jgi:hypothetical protein
MRTAARAIVIVGLFYSSPIRISADSASVITTTMQLPLDGSTVASQACGFEVALSGNIKVTTQVTMSAGTVVNSVTLTNYQGVTGVGTSDSNAGALYRVVGTSNDHYTSNGLQLESTFSDTFALLGQGGAPDATGHSTVHSTIDGSGTATASVSNVHVSCSQ